MKDYIFIAWCAFISCALLYSNHNSGTNTKCDEYNGLKRIVNHSDESFSIIFEDKAFDEKTEQEINEYMSTGIIN